MKINVDICEKKKTNSVGGLKMVYRVRLRHFANYVINDFIGCYFLFAFQYDTNVSMQNTGQ